MTQPDREPSGAVVHDLMDLTVTAVNYEDLANRIVRQFAAWLNAELCTLWRRVKEDGGDNLILSASVGFERKPGEVVPTYPLRWDAQSNREIDGVTPWIGVRKQVCLTNSYQDLAENPDRPWYGSHRGKWDTLQFRAGDVRKRFRSLLGSPICYGAGNDLVAVIKAENTRKPEGFGESDLKLVLGLLPFVAIALQGMTERESHERERQRVLKDLTSALPVVDPTEFYQRVVDQTASLLKADICSLWRVSPDRTKLALAANFGVRQKTNVPEYPLNWEAAEDREIDGLTPWVVIRKRPYFAARYEDLKRCDAHRGKWDPVQWDGRAEATFGSLYAVPLLRANEAIGVLKIENAAGKHVFDEVDKATFDVMADFIALAIEFSSRLRSEMVFDFFHLLKQPTTNAILAFESLRAELRCAAPRAQRVQERMEMLARNLESVRIWTMNVYGLASTPPAVSGEVPARVNLQALLTGIVAEIRRVFPEFECQLSERLKESWLRLTPLERKKAEVIFFNILDNAFKYSRASPRAEVDIAAHKEGLAVTVRDEGVGIGLEDLERIFEPYFSRPAARWPESMGLGLSTVGRLLRDLGWGREVHSIPGTGSSFSIVIPTSRLTEGDHE